MEISYDLLPKQKPRKRRVQEKIDIFPLATELLSELDRFHASDRMKAVKQLGAIHVKKQLEKTRYDYVMLQLYFHQLIRKNIQNRLRFSYNNRIKIKDFLIDNKLSDDFDCSEVTMADVIQILVIMYNVGHFYNTFIASQALVLLAAEDNTFFEHVTKSFSESRHQAVCINCLNEHNYQRVHLLNSLLLLEKCDPSKKSVQLAKELILAYLEEGALPDDSKLPQYFQLFRRVRTVAYISYDLQIADIPFEIDLRNHTGLVTFFDEYLAEFNDGIKADHFVNAMASMLNAAVYNRVNEVICNSQISKMIIHKLKENASAEDYFENSWLDVKSVLNQNYPHRHDYESECLKLTMDLESRDIAERIFKRLYHQSNIRVGYYLRHTGDMTVVTSLYKNCKDKKTAAFKLLQTVVSHLRKLNIQVDDSRYILTVKYFLFFLFKQNNLKIIPVVHESKCVICTRGKNARIRESRKCITKGNEDQKHEVNAMIRYLENDPINDIALVVAGSTVVFNTNGSSIAEFDGIIIYPNRKEDQVILFEAKNIKGKQCIGKKSLHKKLKKLGIEYDPEKLCTQGNDAYVKLTF